MKSHCCTFYKNTSERTGLCKLLDTDSSTLPPAAAHPSPKASSSSAQITECPPPSGGAASSEGGGESHPSCFLWTVPPPFTFQLELCPAQLLSSLAWLLMLFFFFFFLLLLPLRWEISGVSPEAEICLFPFSLYCTSTHLQELRACAGDGRAESASCLKPGGKGERVIHCCVLWGLITAAASWPVRDERLGPGI